MIVIDSSAMIAIVNREPERIPMLEKIAAAEGSFMSAVSLLETKMVVRSRFGVAGLGDLEDLLDEMCTEIIPFDAGLAAIAFSAFERFGKGMGAPGKLNMGDCASYALAKSLDVPLLYKGNDFTETDIVAAI